MTLEKVAFILNTELIGENLPFQKLALPNLANENDLSFIRNHESFNMIKNSKCKNFIISNRLFLPKDRNYIIVKEDPIISLSRLLPHLRKNNNFKVKNKISEKAIISKNAYISENVSIGENSIIEDNVKIYSNVKIGNNVIIYSGAVIGKPGFSHYISEDKIVTLNGIGGVIIRDGVQIGSNTCIDAGIFEYTEIGKNSKIDNLCQIGHDVKLGEQSIICSQVGIAGYSQLGKNTLLYGKVGIKDAVIIGDNFVAKAYSGVTKSFASGLTVSGMPARDDMKNLRNKLKK
ncbi:MAG: hypothetical protein ACRCZR_09650 [Cetobacterium sp.]